MTYADNGRQSLQATLAAGNLDFTPYILDLPPARERPARLEPAAVRPQFAVADRSRHAPVGGAGHRRPVETRPHRARRELARRRAGAVGGEAQIYGGIAKGSFGDRALGHDRRRQGRVPVHRLSTCRPAPANCSASTSFPAAAISTSRWPHPARARLASPPRSTARATLTGHDGAIAGFNVEQLLKRLERRPLSGGGNFRSGSTPLRHA